VSFQATRWAFREAPVTNQTDKLVLVALADCIGPEDGLAYPSITTLEKWTVLGRRTITRSLHNLREQGLIEPAGTLPRGGVAYRLRMDRTMAQEATVEEPTVAQEATVAKRTMAGEAPTIAPEARPLAPERPTEEREGKDPEENTPLPPSKGVPPLRWIPDGGAPRNGRPPHRRLSRSDELRARAAALRAEKATAAERESPPENLDLHRVTAILPTALEPPPRPSVRPEPNPLPEVRRYWKPEELQAIQERARVKYLAGRDAASERLNG